MVPYNEKSGGNMDEDTVKSDSLLALKAEIATLRADMRALLGLLGIPEGIEAVRERGAPLDLRCASLTVVGGAADDGAAARLWADADGDGHLEVRGGAGGRFGATLSAGGEHGGALSLTDRAAGESGTVATFTASEDGAALALCGRDGVPRVVLAGRDAGGGMTLVDSRQELAAELFGVAEASWLALYRNGQPALLAYGVPGADAAVEVYDEEATRRGVLPGG